MPSKDPFLATQLSEKSAWLFDLDGVIIDSMPLHCLAWLKAFKTVFDIDVPSYEIYKREGEKNLVSIRQILAQYGKVAGDVDIQQLIDQKRSFFQADRLPEMYPHMETFLRQLSPHVKLGLVTGTPSKELELLLSADIRSLFQVCITSDMVTHGKPHPEPYLKALQAMHCLVHDAIVIENAPLGIKSAKQAGLSVIALPTSLPVTELYESNYPLESHADLYALGYEIMRIKSQCVNCIPEA